jgi:hyaluronoglucosaminidase
VYPIPHQFTTGDAVWFAPLLTVNQPGADFDPALHLAGCGMEVVVVDNTEGVVSLIEDAEALQDHLPDGLSDAKAAQAYRLTIRGGKTPVDPPKVTITAATSSGLRYGLATLKQILRQGPVETQVIDWPDVAVRGVIEGFYGDPWPHTVRLEMCAMLANLKFSHFMFAPKDDYLHRYLWRDRYPQEILDTYKELADRASELGLIFGYALSPGLSVVHSSVVDLNAITGKFDQMFDIGVRSFALLFDDIPEEMTHPDDLEQFSSQAEGHVHVTTKVWEHLQSRDSDTSLVFCPTHYSDYFLEGKTAKDSDYLKTAASLPEGVDIFWTGPKICSAELTAKHTDEVSKVVGRPVMYWDNYPVNDADMWKEMHIGPYEGREATLGDHAKGLYANPMDAYASSKVPLFTVGDFLWHGAAHDPWMSWEAATEALYPSVAEDLRVVANNLLVCCLRKGDSERLSSLVENWRVSEGPAKDDALVAIESYFFRVRKAVRRLTSTVRYPRLAKEMAPWIRKLNDCSASGLAAVDVVRVSAGEGASEARHQLVVTHEAATIFNVYKGMEKVLTGFVRLALIENEEALRQAAEKS